jgi:hypothetical protein
MSKFQKWLDSTRGVDKLFGMANTTVQVATLIFVVVFTMLQIRYTPPFNLIQALDGKGVISFTLALYYYAWVLAQPIEMKMSRTVYVANLERDKIPKEMYFAIPTVVIVGAILFFVQSNEQYLAAVLTLFFVVDVGFWKTVTNLTYRYEKKSEKLYKRERSYAGLVQLRYYVRSYLRGRWQYSRYVIRAMLLILLDVTAYFDTTRHVIAEAVHGALEQISEAKAFDLMFAVLFFIYIVIGEGWVWTMRLRARRMILLVDDLRQNYKLSIARKR